MKILEDLKWVYDLLDLYLISFGGLTPEEENKLNEIIERNGLEEE